MDSGDRVLDLDGAGIVGLHTKIPLWRDLRPGSRGSDVKALQSELHRLDLLDASADGVYGAATARAVEHLQKAAGVRHPSSTLHLRDVVWLPARKSAIASCVARVGDTIGSGDEIADTADELQSVSVPGSSLPDPSGGDFVARIGDVEAKIPADGVLTDDKFLRTLEKTPQFRTWTASHAEDGVKIPVQRAKAMTVSVVPASALFDIDGAQACVASGGHSFAARIVASQLGKTYVTFDGEAPDHVDVGDRGTATGCR